MDEAPKRRRFRFSLRTLFIATTLLAIWFGWQVHIVRERQDWRKWLEDNDGSFVSVAAWNARPKHASAADVPIYRKWLGDEPAARIALPHGTEPADVHRAKSVFPEADRVYVLKPSGTGYF